MEHIAVSVIVPIYNAEPWLEECVQSILDQDFPASYGTIEVLLIDDGATDGSGALCDRLAKRDNRIKVVHQENQGLSGARNTGIDMARGRYYAFIDSDDVVRPAYLKKMYEACEAHDAYMAICAVEDVQENGKPLPEPVFTPPTQEGVFRGKDLLNDFMPPTALITPLHGTSFTAPRCGSCCITRRAVCTRMILWRTGCSGGAIKWCACRMFCTITACVPAALCAPA